MLSDDLRDLYQEVILDHQADPRNFREIEDSTHAINGHNPLCGDRLRLFVKLHDGVIEDVAFRGAGCAISTASASMMTELLQGRTVGEAEHLVRQFVELVSGQTEEAEDLGKLKVLAGIREFPARVKCATLAWRTLESALQGSSAPVTTE